MPKPDRRAPPLAAFSHARVALKPIDSLKPASRNARTHSAQQLKKIAESIRTFGFVTPILIDREDRIVAGHGRVEAARRLGLTEIPTLCITHLGPAELRAYAIADNRLAEMAGWDKSVLALEFSDLIAIGGDLDLSVTGFEHAEIDLTIQSHVMASDPADEVPSPPTPAETVTRPGDLWHLGEHRIVCGDVRDRAVVRRLMSADRARMVFTDPPYNVKIDGHVSGLGRIRHAEFACASGEMSPEAFTDFLEAALGTLAAVSLDGSLHYVCMDWRHMAEIMAAGDRVYEELKTLCVWNKTNAGMGSFYRSKHELVFVYKLGRAAHTNNIELGRFGRYRSNVWEYAGVNTWRKGRTKDLADHPTVKPVLLVADALQDASSRGEIVLDGFGGSGTTLLAAERVGRRARLVEIEPRYVDLAIRRWQTATGGTARLADTGQAFGEARPAERRARKGGR